MPYTSQRPFLSVSHTTLPFAAARFPSSVFSCNHVVLILILLVDVYIDDLFDDVVLIFIDIDDWFHRVVLKLVDIDDWFNHVV